MRSGKGRHHNPIKWLVCALVVALALLAGCESRDYVTLNGQTMGTTWRVTFAGPADPEALNAAIAQDLRDVNAVRSTWDPASELSRFNQLDVGESMAVSPSLPEVLAMARRIHEESGGAFDVTIGPLVNIWGFGPDNRPDEIPTDEVLAAALARVDDGALSYEEDRVSRHIDAYVDLSSIAKGYGVDRVAMLLESYGVTDYLVEIGGELKARGVNPRGQPWRIAIEKPLAMTRAIQRTLQLRDLAMATSGDYRNYFEDEGVRYSHIIDPRTGRPITHNVASATVLHPIAAMADGYATALTVMEVGEGMAMAEENGIAALVIIKSGDGFEEVLSPAMTAYYESLGPEER